MRKNERRGARGKRGPFSKSDKGTNRRQTLIARKSNQRGGGHEKLLGQVSGPSIFIKWKHPLVFARSMAFPFLGHVLLASPQTTAQSTAVQEQQGLMDANEIFVGKGQT